MTGRSDLGGPADRGTAIMLVVALVALTAYAIVGLWIEASCGPDRVAVLGMFGPVCVGAR